MQDRTSAATNPLVPSDILPLRILLGAATLALAWILLPFSGTLLWAAILALLFAPVHRWWLARLPGHANLAAGLTLCLALLIVVLPVLGVSLALAQESALVYGQLQSGAINPERLLRSLFAGLPGPVRTLLAQVGLASFEALRRSLMLLMSEAAKGAAGQALSVGQNTLEFLASLLIGSYLAFYLIRDGQTLVRLLRRSLPLSPRHRHRLLASFSTVVRATVKGSLLVALVQGGLGGLAFWALGVDAALLWAALMAVLSLVPTVGAALVWAPVAAWLALTGAGWQALMLTVWGMGVVGLADNLLRPLLVGRDTHMPDALVLISTLGGMAVFGLNGLVLGPVIAAIFLAAWGLCIDAGRSRPRGQPGRPPGP